MNIMKEAHILTKKIKEEYPEVDYSAQLSICISYLYKNKGEVKMMSIDEKFESICNEIVTNRGFEEVEISKDKWEKKNEDGSIKVSRTYIKITFNKKMFKYYINNITNGVCDSNALATSIAREFKEKVFSFIMENAESLKLN